MYIFTCVIYHRYARCLGEIEKLANAGDLMYMFLWADSNQGGHGVKPCRPTSLLWWRKLAILGHANAQNELAVALETGGHWSKDPIADAAEAFKWYTIHHFQARSIKCSHLHVNRYSAGAAQNFRIAIRNLGDCYRDGYGCARNREKASALYARARALGDPDAASRLR
jgi:TPR repeat protein